MLFNSYIFIFGFLPVTLLVAFLLGRGHHPRRVISWLVLCSLFFYAWWRPVYLLLLLFSMACNFACGVLLSRLDGRRDHPPQTVKDRRPSQRQLPTHLHPIRLRLCPP